MENKYITYEIINSKSSINVNKNKPIIDINIKAKGNLTSIMCDYDISNDDGIKKIENEASLDLKERIINLFEFSKENNTDIFSFTDYFYKFNNKYYKKIANDDFYKDLIINVNVNLDIFEKGNSLKVIENEKN